MNAAAVLDDYLDGLLGAVVAAAPGAARPAVVEADQAAGEAPAGALDEAIDDLPGSATAETAAEVPASGPAVEAVSVTDTSDIDDIGDATAAEPTPADEAAQAASDIDGAEPSAAAPTDTSLPEAASAEAAAAEPTPADALTADLAAVTDAADADVPAATGAATDATPLLAAAGTVDAPAVAATPVVIDMIAPASDLAIAGTPAAAPVAEAPAPRPAPAAVPDAPIPMRPRLQPVAMPPTARPTPQPAPTPAHQQRRVSDHSSRWLRLRCAAQPYGLELLKVQEVVLPTPLLPLRGTPEAMLGVMNLRGQVVPVMDLGVHLGQRPLEVTAATRIIVLEENGETLGLRVSCVEDVVTLGQEQIESPDNARVGRTSATLFRGIARLSAEPMILLDASALLIPAESRQAS